MEIKKNIGNRNISLSGAKKRYIVVHYTAGVTSKKGSAMNTANWFKNPSAKGSADYIVDDEEIVQYTPDPERCATWHCVGMRYSNKGGKMYGKITNANAIGIEICSSNRKGMMRQANDPSYFFTDAVLDRAEELIKYLMKKYCIPADNIYRHYDTTGKLCPGIIGWNADSGSEKEWEAFKARFKKKSILDLIKKKNAFTVRVKTTLAIYDSPSREAKVVGTIKDKGVYTISKEKKGWGKLKSGLGWILLANTEKV